MAQNVLIGLGGGIAAYKVCAVISALAKSGVNIRAVLSPKATAFITPLTISTLCRHPAYTDEDFWDADQASPLHIALSDWADLLLIAPLTANRLASLSHGFAQSLLDNVVLASRCPILLAPAMNTIMWDQLVVQRNLDLLIRDPRYHQIGPNAGRLACDAEGMGKMAEPDAIEVYTRSLLISQGKRDLQGQRVLVTAGGTREFLDPVRFMGNPSTGKMGMAIALAAAHRGAQVCVISGPGIEVPQGLSLQVIPITSAHDLEQTLAEEFPRANLTIMAAAVADFRPIHYSASKLPKSALDESLPLEKVPDLIQGLSQIKRPEQKLIGFAAQTGDILPPARQKLINKGLDAIVANPIDQAESGFGSDRNQAIWLDHNQTIELPLMSKLHLAHHLLDLAVKLE